MHPASGPYGAVRGGAAAHLARTIGAFLVLLLTCAGAGSAGAQGGEHRAGVVVQYADGSVETACVSFSEPEITGIELLERSGLPVVTASDSVGGAVCKIGPDGCDYPAEGCFCKREGARFIYWALYTLDGDAWAYANVGAGSLRARDGDVHGWAWGLGESGTGATPPVQDLETICGPAASAPSATALSPAPTTAAASPATAASPTDPTAAAPTTPPAPAPTTTPSPDRQGGGPWGYAGFGALVLILGAGAVLMARRRV